MANLVEIVVGTYEEFLLGYKINEADSEGNKNESSLSITFSTRPHTASIRSIAIGGTYLISGSADDKTIIYDMKTRTEVNILMNHEGTVNAVCFTPDNTHILTGGDDGRLVVCRVGTWLIGADWKKAHNGSAVTHISCHPSSKLALSLGKDLTLKTWNLVTGRCAYTINLKSRQNLGRTVDCIQWSTSGDHFLLTGLRVIEIYSIESATAVKEIKVESKPISACWLSNTEFIVGLENGKLLMSNIEQNAKEIFFEAHEKRVKAVAYLNNILATTSSTGEIIAWTVNLKKKTIKKIASTNTGCRPTCIALLDLTQFNNNYKLLQEEMTETDENLLNEDQEETKKCKIQNVGKVIVEFEEDENLETPKINKKRKLKSDHSVDTNMSLRSKSKKEVVKSNTSTDENESESAIEQVKTKKKIKKVKTKKLPKDLSNKQANILSVKKNSNEKSNKIKKIKLSKKVSK